MFIVKAYAKRVRGKVTKCSSEVLLDADRHVLTYVSFCQGSSKIAFKATQTLDVLISFQKKALFYVRPEIYIVRCNIASIGQSTWAQKNYIHAYCWKFY